MLLLSIRLALGAEPASLPPNHGIPFSVSASGRLLAGHVLADTKGLAPLGIELWVEQKKQEGVVPLVPGMRVLGLPKGERLVAEATDTLMYFDANGDTYLDAADPAFAALSLFVDANGDARIGPGEVRRLGDLGVASVSRFGSVQMKEEPR